jgi:hypothetical protein
MRLRIEGTIDRPPAVVFDFVARRHWENHPRWDPNIIEIAPLDPGPIRAGSRARVRRKRGADDEVLEVLDFQPDTKWVSRDEMGALTLEMTAEIEPQGERASRLTLIADTHARGAIRYALPVLIPVFRRQMRASLQRINDMIERETAER